jgi:hypothetical protein
MVLGLSGCTMSSQPKPTVTPSIVPPPPTGTPIPTHPKATHFHYSRRYLAFVSSICKAFGESDTNTIDSHLTTYAFNDFTGLYYSEFNLQEGVQATVSTVNSWMAHGVQCVRYSPSIHGWGALTTKHWGMDGGWGIFDLNKIKGSGGQWRLNDITFGTKPTVKGALKERVGQTRRYKS